MAADLRDRLLLAGLYVGLALLLGRAHATRVDRPEAERKAALHADVLADRAPDPYQYKLWTVTWAAEGVRRATGARLEHIYVDNSYLSLAALLLAHHLWIARLLRASPGGPGDPRARRLLALLGTLLLAALAHALFLGYFHHPYDLWGVAGFCLLLGAAASGARLAALCALALATGLVWEKHALLAPLWALWRLREGDRFLPTAGRALLLLAACVAVPVGVRLALGGGRDLVDVTPLSAQDWGAVASHHGPFALPFLAVLVATWRAQPRFVRCLWLYVPGLLGLYLASRYFVHELRSFWAWAPVFTATACVWARGLLDPARDPDPLTAAPAAAPARASPPARP